MENEKLLPVIQADRDAAADLCAAEDGEINSWARRMRSGKLDGSFSVQAFARHRVATTRAPADLRSALEAETIERCAREVEEVARLSLNDGRKWFNHPGANEAFEYAAKAIRALAPTKGDQS